MEAIIFDVDGTLWDATDEVVSSWNEALSKETKMEHRVTREELQKEFGKPPEEIMEDLFGELTKKEQLALSEILFRYQNKWMEIAPCKIYKGVPGILRELAKKYEICIVSNCHKGYIEAFLKNTGLAEIVTDHTCPGDTGKLKAENIQLIMERNHLQNVVYVGDTQGDADACRKAGVPMIYAAYGFGEVEGDYVTIHQFDELPKVLEGLN